MLVDSPIETLMDQVHDAILTANFTALATLSPALDAALEALSTDTLPTDWTRLRQKAERNAACALAAGRGVRAAIRRLAEVKQNASGLMTYDEKGNRTRRNTLTELTRRL